MGLDIYAFVSWILQRLKFVKFVFPQRGLLRAFISGWWVLTLHIFCIIFGNEVFRKNFEYFHVLLICMIHVFDQWEHPLSWLILSLFRHFLRNFCKAVLLRVWYIRGVDMGPLLLIATILWNFVANFKRRDASVQRLWGVGQELFLILNILSNFVSKRLFLVRLPVSLAWVKGLVIFESLNRSHRRTKISGNRFKINLRVLLLISLSHPWLPRLTWYILTTLTSGPLILNFDDYRWRFSRCKVYLLALYLNTLVRWFVVRKILKFRDQLLYLLGLFLLLKPLSYFLEGWSGQVSLKWHGSSLLLLLVVGIELSILFQWLLWWHFCFQWGCGVYNCYLGDVFLFCVWGDIWVRALHLGSKPVQWQRVIALGVLLMVRSNLLTQSVVESLWNMLKLIFVFEASSFIFVLVHWVYMTISPRIYWIKGVWGNFWDKTF